MWTKIGSEFFDQPGMLSTPRGARLVHVEAMVWSNTHGTDGRVPKAGLGRITDEPDAAEAAEQLVAAGMWAEDDTHWVLLDFLDDQPTAADAARSKALAKERSRRRRMHQAGDHSECDPRYCTVLRQRESRVSHDTRTDRTEPTVPSRTGPEGRGTGKGRERGHGPASAGAPASRAPLLPVPDRKDTA